MAYTTINKSTDNFTTHLYSGNDSTNNQTSLGMTPDLVWVKCRNHATPSHYIVDKVRGDKKYISSNATTAEQTDSNTFDLVSGGFNLAGGNGWTNVSGRNYASWNWKANGAGSANTDGSINSTVSVNTTAGFSIVKYTGTGANATVGHGLGVAPKMIIEKQLDSGSNDWGVYHASQGAGKYTKMNTTEAFSSHTGVWQGVEPTNTVFSLGNSSLANASGGTHIAYCFAEKQGFSKFGSFTGTGDADGAFVYTGFKPTFLMFKNAGSGSENWEMFDTKRDNINVSYKGLIPNTSGAELTNTAQGLDILSNGFKARANENRFNDDQNTIIYMAFGQSIVGSNNVPCTAR